MRFRLIITALMCAALMLLCSFLLITADPARASSGCTATYTVQYGDTLYSIARRFNTSVRVLMQLNQGRIWNPNYIYGGQVLCVPESPTKSQMGIEIAYQYLPNVDEVGWNLTARGDIGKRVVYPLQPLEAVDVVSTTEEMAAGLSTTPSPVLFGVRNGSDVFTYTLAAVGDERILTSLVITEVESLEAVFPSIPPEERKRLEDELGGPLEEKLSQEELQELKDECWAPRPVAVLGGELVAAARATIFLESEEGVRFPFEVSHVDFLPDASKARRCYGDKMVGFILFPAESGKIGEYRILMLLQGARLGPAGASRAVRCSNWPRRGWFYRWLRPVYGCPR